MLTLPSLIGWAHHITVDKANFFPTDCHEIIMNVSFRFFEKRTKLVLPSLLLLNN